MENPTINVFFHHHAKAGLFLPQKDRRKEGIEARVLARHRREWEHGSTLTWHLSLSPWFLGLGYSHMLVLCLIYEVFLLLWGVIARAGAVIIYIPFLSNGCTSHSREGAAVLDKARTPHAVSTPISLAQLLPPVP